MKRYKLNVKEVKFEDLTGKDLRKDIIQANSLDVDFFEKQLGNHMYTRGSDHVSELARDVFEGNEISFNSDDKEEIETFITTIFEAFPSIVRRSIIASIKTISEEKK